MHKRYGSGHEAAARRERRPEPSCHRPGERDPPREAKRSRGDTPASTERRGWASLEASRSSPTTLSRANCSSRRFHWGPGSSTRTIERNQPGEKVKGPACRRIRGSEPGPVNLSPSYRCPSRATRDPDPATSGGRRFDHRRLTQRAIRLCKSTRGESKLRLSSSAPRSPKPAGEAERLPLTTAGMLVASRRFTELTISEAGRALDRYDQVDSDSPEITDQARGGTADSRTLNSMR